METIDQQEGFSNQFNSIRQTLIGDKSNLKSKDQEDVESNRISLKYMSAGKKMIDVEVHHETSFIQQASKLGYSNDDIGFEDVEANESEAMCLQLSTSFQTNTMMTSFIDVESIKVDDQSKLGMQRNREETVNMELLPLLHPPQQQQQLETGSASPDLSTSSPKPLLAENILNDPKDGITHSGTYSTFPKSIGS